MRQQHTFRSSGRAGRVNDDRYVFTFELHATQFGGLLGHRGLKMNIFVGSFIRDDDLTQMR